MRQRAYWKEFQEQAIKKGLAQELPGYEAIEVLDPIRIEIYWKGRRRYWSGQAEYMPGQVLHREWRKASPWEAEDWKKLSGEKLRELGVWSGSGGYSIQIVEKITDLHAAIRQRGRHIPAREIARKRRAFTLAGDAQILANYGRILSALLENMLQGREQAFRSKGEVSPELSYLALELERTRTSFKRQARKEILLAQTGKFWQASLRVSQATTYLLQERVRDFEVADQSMRLAEKWLGLMQDIEQRFRHCYSRLGQIGERLQGLLAQGRPIEPGLCLSIAREGQGIWLHLEQNVPNFDPYYQRLQAPEWQRLSGIVAHAQAGRVKTVYNNIEAAAAKLEAVAIRVQPTRTELARSKKELF